MKLEMQIEIRDPRIIGDLFEASDFRGLPKKTITKGVTIQLKGYTLREAVDFPEIVSIAIYVAKHVALPIAVGVLSRYLYDKLKDKKNSKVTINNVPVEINAEKIENLVIEILKKEEKE
jgi:hypothetical protein